LYVCAQGSLDALANLTFLADETVEDLPPEAYQVTPKVLPQPSTEVEEVVPSPTTSSRKGKQKRQASDELEPAAAKSSQGRARKKLRRDRGPRLGMLAIDHKKPWAILDASGKMLEIVPNSGPHLPDWLARAVDESQGVTGFPSAAASPAALLEESDGSEVTSPEQFDNIMDDSIPDVMLAINFDNQGQATDPSEAFYAHLGHQIIDDVLIDAEYLAGMSDPDDEADLPIDLSTFIEFEGDSSGDESPFAVPASRNRFSICGNLAHLNNSNVMSFRRNADPVNAAVNSIANTASSTAIANAQIPLLQNPEFHNPLLQTPQVSKRNTGDSPYSSPNYNYNGSTPVVRVLRKTPKRRTIMT
jgi:hypothetical protein